MALRQNNAEGQPSGTVIAASQAGSGDSFSAVTSTGSPTYEYTTSQYAHGSQSYHIDGTTSDQVRIDFTGASVAATAARLYLRFASLPSAATNLIEIRNVSGGQNAAIGMNGGKLQVKDTASTPHTFSGTLSVNTWYRVEIQATVSSSAGTVSAAYYLGDNTSPVEAAYSTSMADTTDTNVSYFRFGKPTTATAFEVYYDDIAWNYGSAAPIGPYTALINEAPTAHAGSDETVEPYSIVTLTGTDSDSDGTVASRVWTQVSGSPTVTLSGSGATRTYLSPGTLGGTTLVFGYQVVDDQGASSAQSTVTHTVLAATERAVVGGVEVPVNTKVVSGGALI